MNSKSVGRFIRCSLAITIALLFVGTSLAIESNISNVKTTLPIHLSRETYTFNPTDDSYAGYYSDVNGALTSLNLRNGSTNDYNLAAPVLKFDISAIPSNSLVLSATLELFYLSYTDHNPAGRALTMRHFDGDWNEETFSRNNMPEYSSDITAITNAPGTTGVWVAWDVTSDVQEFISGGMENYGWIIKDEQYWSGSGIPLMYFCSKEYGSSLPYLEIELTDDTSSPTVPQISGPTEGLPDFIYSYNFTSSDPNSDPIYYWIEWGDGDSAGWLGPYASGQTPWDNPGEYTIQVKAKDTNESESGWGTYLMTLINNAPLAPQITGPANGHPGNLYEYTIVSTDPEQNSIW